MKNEDQTKNSHSTLWIVCLIVFILSIFGMGSEAFSTFITSPQNAVGPLNVWARCCYTESQFWWYFGSDFFFALSLFGLHWLIYKWLSPETSGWKNITILGVFGLSLVLDLLETYFIAIQFDNELAFAIQNWKALAYSLGWIILIYLGFLKLIPWIRRNIHADIFNYFLKEYFPYFYPGIISILALFILISSMDQFDTLILELTDPINFTIFSILFLGTVIKVWFMPSYAKFSTVFYRILMMGDYSSAKPEDQENKIIVSTKRFWEVISYAGIYKSIKSLLRNELMQEIKAENLQMYDKVLTEPQNPLVKQLNILPNKADLELNRILRKVNFKIRPIEFASTKIQVSEFYFHLIRRILGLVFILTLFWLQLDTLGKTMGFNSNTALLIVLTIAGLLTWLFAVVDRHVHRDDPDRTKEVKRQEAYRWFLIFSILFVVSGIVTVLAKSLWNRPPNEVLLSFSITIFLSAIAYIFLTVFRYPKESISSDDLKRSASSDAEVAEEATKALQLIRLDTIQHRMTAIMTFYGAVILPLLLIIVVIYCLVVDIGTLWWLNAINFYLIIANGLICTLTVIHRWLNIYFKRSHYERTSEGGIKEYKTVEVEGKNIRKARNALAILGTVVIIFLFLGQSVNYHHTINYEPAGQEPNKLSFEGYSRQFLDRLGPASQNDTIYFVAAEGGGLRAAFWTMLVLDKLDEDVQDRIFMMSGASGGAIGQGMFNFMTYQGVSKKRPLIDSLGRHNFLTTDVAGLFTRGVAGKFLPFPRMADYPDRHRLMAKRYFYMLGGYDAWKDASEYPFYHLWQDRSKALPLIVVNTTRTLDGSRAVVHPLLSEGSPFSGVFEDISSNYEGQYISYADAVFLTNRFPLVSPSARIESAGYFVDGGYYENSGLQSILQVLSYINGQAATDSSSVFAELSKCSIQVINIRNSSTAFYSEQLDKVGLLKDSMNRITSNREIGNIIGATANGGITALPFYYHAMLKDPILQKHMGVKDYHTINLPYRVGSVLDFNDLVGGQIVSDSCRLNEVVRTINADIKDTYPNPFRILMPPLGRMIPEYTARYMEDMLGHPEVAEVIEEIK